MPKLKEYAVDTTYSITVTTYVTAASPEEAEDAAISEVETDLISEFGSDVKLQLEEFESHIAGEPEAD